MVQLWFFVSERIESIGEFAVMLVCIAGVLTVLSLLKGAISKLIQPFRKIKSERAEVVRVGEVGGSLTRQVTVFFRFPDRKVFRYQTIYMDNTGLGKGDAGILHHQGKQGKGFENQTVREESTRIRYYDFGFAKKKKQEVKQKPEHKKRKYW